MQLKMLLIILQRYLNKDMNFIDENSVQYLDYSKLRELGFNLVATKIDGEFTYSSYQLYFDNNSKVTIGISYNSNELSWCNASSYWVNITHGQKSLLTVATSTLDELIDEIIQAAKK